MLRAYLTNLTIPKILPLSFNKMLVKLQNIFFLQIKKIKIFCLVYNKYFVVPLVTEVDGKVSAEDVSFQYFSF